MALSKVMASSTSANSDQTRQPSSLYSVTATADFHNTTVSSSSSSCVIDPTKTFSMSMDDILRNIYAADPAHQPPAPDVLPTHHHQVEDASGCRHLPGGRTVDEVWKEISSAHSGAPADRGRIGEGLGFKEAGAIEEMTLEDFLAKAGAVREEDVRVPAGPVGQAGQQQAPEGFGVDSVMGSRFQPQQQVVEGSSVLGFGNGVEGGGVGRGRGKRRAVQEPVDRVAQQRQRRMIKNRESAARSRERKQAYTVELESLVMQLEEENARLQRQQAEQTKKRLQQLKQNLIPIEESQRPPRRLRKTNSMSW